LVDHLAPLEQQRVLDLSTGTGIVALEIAQRHQQTQIEALDLSEGMLAQARQKATAQGVQKVHFQQGDVEQLPYDDGSFDRISCGYGMFFYPEMELTFQRIFRKLKAGGRLVFSSFTADAFQPYAELFLQRIETEYQIETPIRSLARLKSVEQMRALSALADPAKIKVEVYPIAYSITLAEWWALLNSAGYKGLLDQLNAEQLPRFKADHLAEVAALATDGRLDLNADTMFAVVEARP
ncbi:MAG: methyltransferase domain-containing protein, partial [Gammaproteobacteria bacterium]|nr:methyltransferase domain-containing protein [Gammaproteobacteria bacterium]